MSSSTSSSEDTPTVAPATSPDASRWKIALLFGLVLAALIIPQELAVRASERLYGVDRVAFRPPLSDNQKLDLFLEALRTGRHFALYCVGSSVCEYGLHPDVLAEALPDKRDGVYNLGFSGSSFIAGLELLELLDIHPQVLLVSISPFELTRTGTERGDKIVAHAAEQARALGLTAKTDAVSRDPRTMLEQWTRDRVYTVLHCATPARRRTLPQWLSLLRAWRNNTYRAGDLLRFLNNEAFSTDETTWASMRYYVEFCSNGYLGLKLRWKVSPDEFERTLSAPLIKEIETTTAERYRLDSPACLEKTERLLARFRDKGTRVVLVRLPEYARLLDAEDALGFARDLEALARRLGATLVTPDLVGREFCTNTDHFRDAEHLHHDSSIPYSRTLAERLRTLGLPSSTH